MHEFPCSYGRLAILCPGSQRPAGSTMASSRARNLFLLENSGLKFDLSGVDRLNKHDIFKSQYHLGEFHHIYNELRKDPIDFFEYYKTLPSTFDYTVQAISQHNSHTSTNFHKRISALKNAVCVAVVGPTCYIFDTIQFRDGASWVHWKSATFFMTQIHW